MWHRRFQCRGWLAQDSACKRAGHVADLLQQNCVVALKGLEDVMIRAPHAKPIDGGIAMAAAGLPTH